MEGCRYGATDGSGTESLGKGWRAKMAIFGAQDEAVESHHHTADRSNREIGAHRTRLAKKRLRLGPAWADYDLVFPSELGTPLTHSNTTQVFKRILKRAGLRPSTRLYDLRHTHAILLLKAEVHPKIVIEPQGHSTVALTLDVYSHVLPSMQAKAADHIDNMLFQWIAS